MRKWHRISGIFAATFLVVLSVTGILLNHPTLLGKADFPPVRVTAQRPGTNELWIGTEKGVYTSKNEGKTLYKLPLRVTDFPVTDIEFIGSDIIMIAYKNRQLIRSENGGKSWRNFSGPKGPSFYYDVDLKEDGSFYLTTDSGIYEYANRWKVVRKTSETADLHYLIRKIHSGYIFAPLLIYVYDLSAVILILLTISGFVLFYRHVKR